MISRHQGVEHLKRFTRPHDLKRRGTRVSLESLISKLLPLTTRGRLAEVRLAVKASLKSLKTKTGLLLVLLALAISMALVPFSFTQAQAQAAQYPVDEKQ